MKKICHKNIQRHIASLIPITESYIAVIADVEQINNHLSTLPAELKALQQQTNILNLKSNRESTDDVELQLTQTEFLLDSLVDNLEQVSTNLATFEYKLKNILALQERLEALQAERIHDFTPERIYKLLEKEKLESLPAENTSSQKRRNIYWQKLTDLKHKFYNRKFAISLGIIASLYFCWTGGYLSAKLQENNGQAIEVIEKE